MPWRIAELRQGVLKHTLKSLSQSIQITLRRRFTRNILFGFFFYLIIVSITYNNFTKGGELDVYFASDRYTYLSGIGILYLVGIAMVWIYRHKGSSHKLRIAYATLMTVILVALTAFAVRTYTRSMDWIDSETLYTANLATYPDSYIVQNNLGSLYLDRGEVDNCTRVVPWRWVDCNQS